MALNLPDRVLETTATIGTGPLTLLGASTGYRSFSAVGDGNSCYYCIAAQTTGDWEVGVGTYTAATATLSRDTVLSSSNSGSLVSFPGGTKNVFVTYPSARGVWGSGTTLVAPTGALLPVANGGTGLGSFSANRIHYGSFSTTSTFVFDGSNLGIGTSAPNERLHINSQDGIRAGATGTTSFVRIGSAVSGESTSQVSYDRPNQALIFSKGNTGSTLSELARFDTSGNLGIGTTTPGQKLDVVGTGKFNSIEVGANNTDINNVNLSPLLFKIQGTERMRLDSSGNLGVGTSATTSYGGRLNVYAGDIVIADSGTSSGASAPRVGSSAQAIVFKTNTGGGSAAEVARIDGSGNFGIGTASPGARLQVKSLGQTVIIEGTAARGSGNVYAAFNDPTGRKGYWGYGGGNDAFYLANEMNAPMLFLTNNTEYMRLDTSGNLGIGTSAPGYKLDVAAAGTVTARVQNTTSTADAYFLAQNTVGSGFFGINATGPYIYTSQSIPMLFYTAATERMRLDASGNLGVGITPNAWSGLRSLQVGTGSLSNNLAGDWTNVASNAYYDGTNWRYIVAGPSTASLYRQLNSGHSWFTAPSGTAGNTISFTQAMTLNSSGSLVVGSTTANRAGANTGISVEGASTSILEANVNASRAGFVYSDAASTTVGEFRNFPLFFRTNDTERARIDASGNFIHQVNGSAPSLSTNSTMSFELTSNTSLKVVVRGTDGVTRSVSLTLS